MFDAFSPFKEPRPAIYALHLIKDEDIPIFKDFVLRTTWQDAKNTYTTSAFQVHALDVATRVPPTKHRVDPRQGTIDQDPEFQAFLHNLTQPKESQSKETENGDQPASTNDESKEKPVSHLVRYIQEKKAAKAKEAAAAKSAKHNRQDSQSAKAKAGDDSKKKGKENKTDKSDKDKEKDKPAPKLLTKKAAAQEAAAEAAKQASSTKTSEDAIPKSRRANIAQAAKILQRDLGLSPGSAHRRARQNAAKAEATTSTEPAASTSSEKETADVKEPESSKTVPSGPKAQANDGSRRSRGKAKAAAAATGTTESNKGRSNDGPTKPTTGPIVLLKKEASKKEESSAAVSAASTNSVGNANTPTTSSGSATAAPPTGPKGAAGKGGTGKGNTSGQQKKGAAQPGPGAMRAFVKHANPSQGVTESLLKQAMEAYGPITFVEIDKRKGFAYVDFSDADGLRKAIAASPVSIAQGTVQVLERKDKKPTAAPATPTQVIPSDKPSSDSQAASAASVSTSTSADRPKRGNRGRGRRGGGASANPTTGTNGASNDTPSSAAPAAG